MDYSEKESERPVVIKPQIDNHVLERAILRLNFSPPVKITCHRYKEDVRNWLPPKDIFQNVPEPPEDGFDLDEIEITEVSTGTELNTMIEHLSQMSEWAVDVEHHDLHSYAGITCLIQISTTKKHFLIDPFSLNIEIKRDLKPLMESGSHIKVMHGSHNDLRWLQRDFDIFVWPVVDTQVICKKLDSAVKNPQAVNNVSLLDLIDTYFSFDESQLNNFSTADFRIRPLPHHLKRYAIFDTIYLLPVIFELGQEIELETNLSFITLVKDCANYMAKVALYSPKVYPSIHESMFQFQIGYKIATKFSSLFNWRSDKAKILDENPNVILGVSHIVDLIDAVTAPADISLIESFLSYSRKTKYMSKIDFAKIKEIIDTEKYTCVSIDEALFPCMSCGEYSHPPSFWPGGEQNCHSRGKLYFEEKWNEKILPFTWKELNWFSNEIRACIKNVIKLLRCQMCSRIVRKAVMFDCECLEQPIACKTCWISICPTCHGETSQDGDPVKLKKIDDIHNHCKLFLKALKENYVENLFAAIMKFLFAVDWELLCSCCFKPLSKTQLAPVDNRIALFCDPCCQLVRKPNSHIRFGFKVVRPFKSQLLDEIIDTFAVVLSKFHSHWQPNLESHSNGLDVVPKSSYLNINEDFSCTNTNYYYYLISNLIKVFCASFVVLIVSYIIMYN